MKSSLGWYPAKGQMGNGIYGEEREQDLTPEYRAGSSQSEIQGAGLRQS